MLHCGIWEDLPAEACLGGWHVGGTSGGSEVEAPPQVAVLIGWWRWRRCTRFSTLTRPDAFIS